MAVSCADYIIAFNDPVTDDTYKQAKKDIESMKGKVTFEFRTATKGVMATLPDDVVTTLNKESYIDFIEKDQSVHI
ncbi:hypothetical protein K501DRAFT_284998 [Backusella circina FSU 941]|nr:hypothetical protein K501DRAFT_284998 [Backusella circina FSU 941]